ncbi:MAG TPA: hypothetical protein VKC53_01260 [Patescibacteria group bacterium]|nr:hypothetical protein [Patescibacteria group bacterium]
MKTSAKILLVIFFVILFLGELLSGTFKFQLLNYNFWQNAFQKHNTYQSLATASKSSFESQIGKEGGNKNDVKILTDLITPENTKDVLDKNLKNVLSFANGTSSQINVYVPVDKIPKNLLPKTLNGLKTDMPLQELLTKFNFQDYQNIPLKEISQFGKVSSNGFIAASLLLIFILFLLFLLIKKGERLISLGIAFILSGSLTFFVMEVAIGIQKSILSGLPGSTSVVSVFVSIIAPAVISEVVIYWQILGFALLILGVVLFFVRKPGYNVSK